MHHADVRRCAEALATKVLPICPGDMLVFQASGDRMLVVCASMQMQESGSAGQRLAGLTSSSSDGWWWDDFWIDWRGLNTVWTIVRLP